MNITINWFNAWLKREEPMTAIMKTVSPRSGRHLLGLAVTVSILAMTGPATAVEGPTFSIGVSTPINQLIPFPPYQMTMPWIHSMTDALVAWRDGGPVPALAESWEMSDDQKTLTVKLRQGVTFHDGKPLVAQNVVDILRWASDPANRATGSAFLATGTFTAVDDATVKLEFPLASPQVITVLAVIPIVDLTSDLVSKPNGTGPFKVTEFIPSTSLTLERNDNYWDKEHIPEIGTLQFPMFPDNASLMAALQSGQINALGFPDFRQLSNLEAQGMQLVTDAAPGNFMIRVNTTDEALSDRRVREALSLSINREVFSQLMTGGKSTPTCSIFPPDSPVYTPESDEGCTQDLDAAKALLEEAGYGDGLTLGYMAGTVRQPELTGFVPIWQEDLAKIGVTLEIEDLASAVLTERTMAMDYDLTGDWYPWGVFDPAVFFIGPSFAPNNLEGFREQAYLDMLDAAQSEVDQAKRLDMYKDLNRYMVEQRFIIPVATRPYFYAVRPEISGFKIDPFGMAIYTDIDMP
jgi:peptide/nickel transport system substrate-binding protein